MLLHYTSREVRSARLPMHKIRHCFQLSAQHACFSDKLYRWRCRPCRSSYAGIQYSAVQCSVKDTDYLNSTRTWLVVLRMRTCYIQFPHVVNWTRNSLVCSPYLLKDLYKQEAKHRISYLREAHLANISSRESSCLANYSSHVSVQCCLILTPFVQYTVVLACSLCNGWHPQRSPPFGL